jgi:hypothetical protein
MGTGIAEAALPESGIDPDYPVRLLQHEGLIAIISRVPRSNFGGDSLNEMMKDGAWVRNMVRAHAGVLEQFNGRGTVVPLRFGTICGNEAGVRGMLDAQQDRLQEALQRLEGKQEWGLRMYRDLDRLSQQLEQSQEKVEDSLNHISKGVAPFIKAEVEGLDESKQDALELVTQNCVKRCHDALGGHTEATADKALLAGTTEGKGEMIANTAFLVQVEQEEAFCLAIDELAERYAELGFVFELTGPWPPYHFVD